jgi:hypothetical protein
MYLRGMEEVGGWHQISAGLHAVLLERSIMFNTLMITSFPLTIPVFRFALQ